MKTIRIIRALTCGFAAAAAVSTTHAQAIETKPIPSRVVEATVFLSGAELTQTATATLGKGAGEVSIEGLSPTIDINSLRINIGGGVVVSAFEYSIDYLSSTRTPSARLKMLTDSIAVYKAQLNKIDVDIKVNAAMQGYLETGIAKNVSGSEAGLGIDELKETMDYYRTKSEEMLNGARELADRAQKINAARERLTAQYNQEAGGENKTSGVLRLGVTAPTAGTFPVTITYFTPSASWSPYYDVNARSTDSPIRFAAKSRVSQTTGLDWENVRLTLSSATPSSGRVAPLFSTWFLRERKNVTGMMRKNAAVQNEYSFAEFSEDFVIEEAVVVAEDSAAPAPAARAVTAPAPTPTIYDHVTTADNALTVTYDIDLPYNVPGNGKEQNIDLSTAETPAVYKYYAAPKLDGATYLVAEIEDWQDLGLLSAPANITYDGTYIGETWIDAGATDEKLTLTLGTDKRVGVARELAREFSTTRAIGNNTEQTFVYKITVRNSQTGPVYMVLKDQYPTSTDRNITVTLDTRTTTPPTTDAKETGVVTWEGELAAGEVREYMFGYTVRHPREMELDM